MKHCNKCNYVGCQWLTQQYPKTGHYIWTIQLTLKNARRWIQTRLAKLTDFDYTKISDVQIDGIDTSDWPDMCDAYISSASYKGKTMTESQLEKLNNNSNFIYEQVMNKLY